MNKLILLAIFSIFTINGMAQGETVEYDGSLMVNILKVTDKGYISIRDIPKATQLNLNETDGKIISFVFTWQPKDTDTVVEMFIKGATFSEEMKLRLKEFKIGQKFFIDKVIVENSSGTVNVRPAKFTIKS